MEIEKIPQFLRIATMLLLRNVAMRASIFLFDSSSQLLSPSLVSNQITSELQYNFSPKMEKNWYHNPRNQTLSPKMLSSVFVFRACAGAALSVTGAALSVTVR
jgi:hypothetical protein